MRSSKVIKNILSSLMLQIIIIICGFIIPKIIIKSFGSNVNGLIASITQFLSYITLLEAGVGPVIKATLYKPIASKDKTTIANIIKSSEKYFRKISLIFVVYIIILLFIYPQIVSKEFELVYTGSLILIISISTFAEYFFGMTYKLFLQAQQKTYVISAVQIITYVLNLAIIILLAQMNVGIHFLKLFSGIIFAVRPIILYIYVKIKFKIKLNDTDNNYKLKNKWDGMVQHIAAVVHNSTDITILTIMSTLIEVSVYSVYMIVVKGVKSIIQSFTSGIDASFGDMIAKNETDHLNKSFNNYETFYHTIVTIVYACTIILITPFISVYTRGMSDANYIRPLFGYLIVISEFAWSLRMPYSSITLAAGHFKETKKGALVEAAINIVLSIVLVKKCGIIGVAIGTLVAMLIRTIEFVYHSNKYILKRNAFKTFNKLVLVIAEVLLIVFIVRYIPVIKLNSYMSWIQYAFKVFLVACIIVLGINIIVYKESFKEFILILKRNLKNVSKKGKI